MAKVKVDMTGVESYVRCEEGEQIATLMELKEETASTGTDMLVGKFEVAAGSSTGAILYENFPLSEKAKWKLKQLLDSYGMKSDGKIVIDTEKMVGKKNIIEVRHEPYEGKVKARIDAFKKLEEKKPKDTGKGAKGAAAKDDAGDDDDEWEES